MADFLTVNGFFSRVWPDTGKFRAYFSTGMRDYYVMGFLNGTEMAPREYEKASLELQKARRDGNEAVVTRSGKPLYYIKSIGPDLSHRAGLFKYLTSKIFDGVGEATANKLLDSFGTDVLEVIASEPERLLALGIRKDIVDVLIGGVTDPEMANVIMQWLPDMQQSCAKALGDYYYAAGIGKQELQAMLNTDPYDVYRDAMEYCTLGPAQLKSVFLAVDHYAIESGRDSTDPKRLDAAIDVAVKAMAGYSDSTYLDVTDAAVYEGLMNQCADCLMFGDIQTALLAAADRMALRQSYCNGERMLYTQRMLRAEKGSAGIIRRLEPLPGVYAMPDDELDSLIASYRTPDGQELDPGQRHAVKTAMTRRLSVITGGPGTGKTTILDAVVWVWKRLMDYNAGSITDQDPDFYYITKEGRTEHPPTEPYEIFLMAPTGKAAQRMNEKIPSRETGIDATTIALRLLMAKEENGARRATPTYYKNKLAIIDETSMVGMTNAADLLYLMQDCQLVFVGDCDQLLPVGPGQFLMDLITCLSRTGSPCLARLTEQHRSAENKVLMQNADIIRNGGEIRDNQLIPCMPAVMPGQYLPVEYGADGRPISDAEICQVAVDDYVRHFDRASLSVCLVTPMHPSTCPSCSDRLLNLMVQERVNPEQMLTASGNGRTVTINTGNASDKQSYTGQLYGIHPDEPLDWNHPELVKYWGCVIYKAAYLEFPTSSGRAAYGRVSQLRIGDRVLVTRNNYAARMFNGDTGMLVGYLENPEPKGEDLLVIAPDTPRADGSAYCCIRESRFNEIELGYCLTVHKTQGSEYGHVVLALPQSLPYKPICNRSLLYTAETRAKSSITVVGQTGTVWACIQKLPPVRRTKLVERVLEPDGYVTDPDLNIF